MCDFISTDQIIFLGLDNFLFLCCTGEDDLPSEHIFGSYLFQIPFSTSKFLQALRSISIPTNLVVVCYDNRNYNDASKVYWGLRAVGYSVHVLLKVTKIMPVLVIVSGPPEKIHHNKSEFRDINYELITTAKILSESKKNIISIKINYIGFEIATASGSLISKDLISSYMASTGLIIPKEKFVVKGRKAYIGALLLKHLGKNDITILIDYEDFKKDRSVCTESSFSKKLLCNSGFTEISRRSNGTEIVSSASYFEPESKTLSIEEKNCVRCDLF